MSTAKAQLTTDTTEKKITPANLGGFKLYEIDSAVAACTELLELAIDENGQIVDELLEAKILKRLEELNMAKELKATNVAAFIKGIWAQVEMFEKERLQLARREKSLTRKAEWLTRYLVSYLQADPEKPGIHIAGVRALISWRRSDNLEVSAANRLPLKFQRASVLEITEDELIRFMDVFKQLKNFQIEPRKDQLKKHIKSRRAIGRKFSRIARLKEKFTIQIT